MVFKNATILIILVIVLWCLLSRKLKLEEAIVFLIPFKSIYIDFGLHAVAYYVPLVFALIVQILGKRFVAPKVVLPYFIYATLSTLVVSTLFIEYTFENVHYSNYFRNNGRSISAVIKMLVFQFGLVALIYGYVKKHSDIEKLIRIYLRAVLLLVCLGLIQVAIEYVFGFDLFPIRINNSGRHIGELVKSYSSFGLIRPCAIAGEPKGLAVHLATAIAMLYYIRKVKFNINIDHLNLKLLACFVALVLTVSTGGLGLLVIFIAYELLLQASPFFKRLVFRKTMLYSLIFTVIAMIAFFKPLSLFIENRFLDRPLGYEADDSAIIKSVLEEPHWYFFGPGVGNVTQIAHKYISERYQRLNKGNILNSRYGYMKLISESGLVGFALFSFMVLVTVRRLKKVLGFNDHPRVHFLTNMIIVLFLFFLARGNYIYPVFLVILGISMKVLILEKINIPIKFRLNENRMS